MQWHFLKFSEGNEEDVFKEKEKKEENNNNGNKLEKEQIIIRVMFLGPYLTFHILYLSIPSFVP